MRPRSLTCPRCAVPMREHWHGEEAVAQCPGCDGLWLDHGQLAKLTGTREDLAGLATDDGAGSLAVTSAPTCPSCAGVCLVEFAHPQRPTLKIERCPYCQGLWLDRHRLAALRALSSTRTPAPADAPGRPLRPSTVAPAAPVLVDPDEIVARPLGLRAAVLTLPLAFLFAWVCKVLQVPGFFLGLFRVSLHELGHATGAWLCGWMAVPLPHGWTVWSPGRSWVVVLGLLGVAAVCIAGGIRRRQWGFVAAGTVLVTVQAWCTFHLGLHAQEALAIWSGCGGEYVFSALLVAAFYYPLPRRMHWPIWRYVALVIGSYAFLYAFTYWREAARDWSLIPWEGAYSDDGDMSHLRDDHGWDELRITRGYVALGWSCAVALGAHYLHGVAAAVWRSRRPLAATK